MAVRVSKAQGEIHCTASLLSTMQHVLSSSLLFKYISIGYLTGLIGTHIVLMCQVEGHLPTVGVEA